MKAEYLVSERARGGELAPEPRDPDLGSICGGQITVVVKLRAARGVYLTTTTTIRAQSWPVEAAAAKPGTGGGEERPGGNQAR